MADNQRRRMRGKVFPIQGCRRPRRGARLPAPPKTWRPTMRWVHQGGSARQQSQGRGRGRGFCDAAANAIMPGRIHQHHRRPDAGRHGPGPAPVSVLGHQANLRESRKSKELATLRLQVLVVVKANDACESKKEIIRLRE
jgi:hypothetical protein